MKSFGLTDKGKVRKDNQDCFIIEKCQSKACMIVALCDGMGGAKAGGIASQLSNKAFVSYIYAKLTSRVSRTVDYKRMLSDACAEANGVSYEYSHFDEAFSGMGTTMTVIWEDDERVLLGHVGDSRAYRVREKSIRQISQDHSMVAEMVRRGVLTEEEARVHPYRNIITRALGTDETVEVDAEELDKRPGDLYLLCSDGLSEYVQNESLLYILRKHPSLEEAADVLLNMALEGGGRDNISVVLAEVTA